jgi:rod shape determining protein RodA
VLRQPDLGTALLLLMGGGAVMFLAGVSWIYFAVVIALGGGLVFAVLASRGTEWQLLKDYQYRRIDAFLDPSIDPLGAGYHISQSKIALGSGGWSGRGFMQGTQSRLNFLPEKHTDFIFTTLAEEFGFIGGVSLLVLYALIIVFCVVAALKHRDRFARC